MRTISKSLKYNDDRALVPTGMEGRRLPKKFLKQVNKLQRSNSLTRKVFGTRLCGGVRDVSRHGVEPSVWSRCGSTAAGFETWKKQFAGEAQARVVTASTIAALMATTYSTATIAGQSEPLAIQKTAPSFSHSRFIEGTVRVLPSAAMQRPNLVAPLAHTTRALWRDRAERRSHGAAE